MWIGYFPTAWYQRLVWFIWLGTRDKSKFAPFFSSKLTVSGKRRAVKKESVSRDLFIGQLFIVANHNLELDLDFLSKTRAHAADANLVF